MFCYQCEQTAKGEGCTKSGVCGKQPDVAALQDLLTYALTGLSLVAVQSRKIGISDPNVNVFTCEALFSTVTNVNFDPNRFVPMISTCVAYRDGLIEEILAASGKVNLSQSSVLYQPADTIAGLIDQATHVGLQSYPASNPDVLSLKHTLLFGLRGIAAYVDHAWTLGKEDEDVYSFIHEGLSELTNDKLRLEDAVNLILKCGEINLRAMELLDMANTAAYGDPVPTNVSLGAKKGKAILVSGHDLKDLEELLKQTVDKGIFVYTHGEMLPCHGYPGLKKYPHLYGHYGSAWQNQSKEFAAFPGAIVMTTNCLQRPEDAYKENIFTSGLVGWPGINHIPNRDFRPVAKRALELPGFQNDIPGKQVMVGFGRKTLMAIANKITELINKGKIRRLFLVAGCDGAKPGRNYYTRFVELVPEDCIVLTLACGKYRFYDHDMGDIDGIPRLIDIGQCNDAYSAIQMALALSETLGRDLNELPLSFVLSWYEQKAVAILLTLLALKIKNIRIGPTLPAFLSPRVLNILVEHFNIMPVTTPENDLQSILS